MKKPGYQIDVKQVGTEQFPRWAIGDSRGRWLSDHGWSNDPSKALRYANEDEANQLCLECRDDIPRRRFFVPLKIVVNANGDFSIEDLREYLRRNLGLYLNDDDGEHVCDNATYDVKFFWHELDEAS